MDEKISPTDLAEIFGVSRQYIYSSNRNDWGPDDILSYTDDLVDTAVSEAKTIKQRLNEYLKSIGNKDIAAFEITEGDKERFMSKVQTGSDQECWEWQAGKAAHGYGQFRFRHRQLGAHRFMYWLHYGEYPGDGFVCHKCDNPGCVNPNHLYLGNHHSNMNDRTGGGYDMSGRNETADPIYAERKEKMIELRQSGKTLEEIAKEFGITRGRVHQILLATPAPTPSE